MYAWAALAKASIAPAVSPLAWRISPSLNWSDGRVAASATAIFRNDSALSRSFRSWQITPRATVDIGEVAVIQDEGELVTPPNAFDIQRTGLRFVPGAGGGYDLLRIDPAFRTAIGDRVTLGDDDSVPQNVPFGFTYYGTAQSTAFVNSDGNITFGEADRASSARSIARLMTGPPRVAPFLADLDPSVGGAVFVRAAADAFTATWCGVRVFGSSRQATMQTSLLPDGTVEMKYAGAPPWTGGRRRCGSPTT